MSSTTVTVDEIHSNLSADGLILIDAERVQMREDGVYFWNGKDYIRRPCRISEKEQNIFVIETL